jgi:hypothetical protein
VEGIYNLFIMQETSQIVEHLITFAVVVVAVVAELDL